MSDHLTIEEIDAITDEMVAAKIAERASDAGLTVDEWLDVELAKATAES